MQAGSIAGGAFLKEFVNENIPWVHFDIAGTAWGPKEPSYQPKNGATGVGVRMVYEFLEDSKNDDKTVITEFMSTDWKDYSKANQNKMLEVIDTTYPRLKLEKIVQVISSLPKDKKFINKIKNQTFITIKNLITHALHHIN